MAILNLINKIVNNTMKIHIDKISISNLHKLDLDNIKFGTLYSDHMFQADFSNGSWKNFTITPFDNLVLSPACTTLHYGQTIFEGLKAYKNKNNEILVFRSKMNAKRFNISAKRMCMPTIPEDYFIEAISSLLKIDHQWIPKKENTSLYIRPLLIALDPFIGIRPADNYKFVIITCPVGDFYAKPLNVKIETKYTRAIKGGVGFSKTAGNYAASLYPASVAQKDGYDQLMWTDGKEHKYIEESGTMNLFFIIDNTLLTAPLGDTVLDGVTRDSILAIAKDLNIKTEVRKITVDEIIYSVKNNLLQEAFGAGTAVTIAPIKTIGYNNKNYVLPKINSNSCANKFSKILNEIKYGLIDDKYNWITKV